MCPIQLKNCQLELADQGHKKVSKCCGTGINSFPLISGLSLFLWNPCKCSSARAVSELLLSYAECSAVPCHTEAAGQLIGHGGSCRNEETLKLLSFIGLT